MLSYSPLSLALLTDSAMRGFAISFLTSRRVASLNALFLVLRGITLIIMSRSEKQKRPIQTGVADSTGKDATVSRRRKTFALLCLCPQGCSVRPSPPVGDKRQEIPASTCSET